MPENHTVLKNFMIMKYKVDKLKQLKKNLKTTEKALIDEALDLLFEKKGV